MGSLYEVRKMNV